jgi:tetratricopeptide (TPR) repeat protein
MTVVQLLTRAGDEIDARFANQPDVAAELHYVMGRSFESFLETALEVKHFRRALELGEHLSGQGSRAAARSASELVIVDYLVGQLNSTIGRYNSILATSRIATGENAPEVMDLRLSLARGYYLLGTWSDAARMFQDLLKDASAYRQGPSELTGRAHFYYGQLLTDLANPGEAENQLRLAIAELRAALGEKHMMVAESHSALGLALSDAGRFAEAAQELTQAHALALQWAPLESWTEVRPRFFTALMLLHQDQPLKAEPILSNIVRYQDDNWAAYLQTHKDATPPLDRTGSVRQALGEAYESEGRLRDAVETLQRAVTVSERIGGPKHPQVLSTKLSLAEALIADHRADEARGLVASLQTDGLNALPPAHPILAHWHRVNGLLEFDGNHPGQARKELARALEIFQDAYGANDWRVVRGRQDLQLYSGSRTTP